MPQISHNMNYLDAKLTVEYDGHGLIPVPIVNYTKQTINFGYVYGHNTDITLEGLYSGIDTPAKTIKELSDIFSGQFKSLVVKDYTNAPVYKWDNVTVDSVNLDTNNYFKGSFVKYTIKLKSYDFPSGIIEPSNEYSYSQNEDGTVNVNHKISARAVRNDHGAFNNAIEFVKSFVGNDPFSKCAPLFVPGGSGALMSITENINRAEAVYSINEVYKYKTGVFDGIIRTTSLDINESIDAEYKTIDYTLKILGSPVKNNVNEMIDSLDYPMLSDIGQEFGIDTADWVKNTYSANIDSGSATIDIKVGYVSGAIKTGFLDYFVSCEEDYLTKVQNWKIDGEFRCFGPLDFKRSQMGAFKSGHRGSDNWKSYLVNLIEASPLYIANVDANAKFSPNCKVDVSENTKMASLKLSLIKEYGYEPIGVSELKYSIDSTPSRWIYELLPSANIEGHFVVQDIQSKTRARQKFSVNGKAYEKSGILPALSGYMNKLEEKYVDSGTSYTSVTAFLTDEEITTGVFDTSVSRSWLGDDKGISDNLLSLQSVGSLGAGPLRPPGYDFGY